MPMVPLHPLPDFTEGAGLATVGGGVKGIQSNVGDERGSTMSSPPLSDGRGDAGVLPANASEPADGDADRDQLLFLASHRALAYTTV
jgi:hypothetical protein